MKSDQEKRRGLMCWLRRKQDEHATHEAHCTSLCCARSGETLNVTSLAGEEREAACLRDLGLREGAVVTVLRHGDPLLVRIGDARFGIGRAAAERIFCDVCEEPASVPLPVAQPDSQFLPLPAVDAKNS